ncbi:tol-pal system YbgF family protein [Candidatus Riflebacteria bacterium]
MNKRFLPKQEENRRKVSKKFKSGAPFPWMVTEGRKAGKGRKKGATGRLQATIVFQKNYQTAIRLSSQKKYEEAIKMLEEIIAKYPNTSEAGMAQYRIAEVYFDKKNTDKAKKEFEKLLKKYPDSPAAENARAALIYLQNIERHKKNYVPPEADKVGRFR